MSDTKTRAKSIHANQDQLQILRAAFNQTGISPPHVLDQLSMQTGLPKKWIVSWFARERRKVQKSLKANKKGSPAVLQKANTSDVDNDPPPKTEPTETTLLPAIEMSPSNALDVPSIPKQDRRMRLMDLVNTCNRHYQASGLVNNIVSTLPTLDKDIQPLASDSEQRLFRKPLHTTSYQGRLSHTQGYEQDIPAVLPSSLDQSPARNTFAAPQSVQSNNLNSSHTQPQFAHTYSQVSLEQTLHYDHASPRVLANHLDTNPHVSQHAGLLPSLHPNIYPPVGFHDQLPHASQYLTDTTPDIHFGGSEHSNYPVPVSDYSTPDILDHTTAPLKHLSVLRSFSPSQYMHRDYTELDSNVLTCLLGGDLVEHDPFQAAMGLVFLSRLGLKPEE